MATPGHFLDGDRGRSEPPLDDLVAARGADGAHFPGGGRAADDRSDARAARPLSAFPEAQAVAATRDADAAVSGEQYGDGGGVCGVGRAQLARARDARRLPGPLAVSPFRHERPQPRLERDEHGPAPDLRCCCIATCCRSRRRSRVQGPSVLADPRAVWPVQRRRRIAAVHHRRGRLRGTVRARRHAAHVSLCSRPSAAPSWRSSCHRVAASGSCRDMSRPRRQPPWDPPFSAGCLPWAWATRWAISCRRSGRS